MGGAGSRGVRWGGGLLIAMLVLLASSGEARADGNLEVHVERTEGVKTTGPNYIPVTVTLIDATTKAPPKENYNVGTYATNAEGEETENYECGNRAYNTAGGEHGVYDCTIIIDHGGRWTLWGAVSSIPRGARTNAEALERTVIVARGSTEVDIDAPTLEGDAPDPYAPDGSPGDVLLLQAHSTFGVLWTILMALLIVLAFPVTRQVMAAATLHRLEDRLHLLSRAAIGVSLVIVATGVWLLLYKTAYRQPFTLEEARSTLRLPYAGGYFATLWTKIGFYLFMLPFTGAIIREAKRRARLASEDGTPDRSPSRRSREGSPWGPPARGTDRPGPMVPASTTSGSTTTVRRPATTVLDRPAVREEADQAPARPRRSSLLARVAAGVIPVGVSVIFVAVTVLKYLHELIEASGALLRR